jgi:hypothetical protein
LPLARFLLFACLLILLTLAPVAAEGDAPSPPAILASAPGSQVTLLAGEWDQISRVPPPAIANAESATATFVVNFLPSRSAWEQWQPQAPAAFEHAVSIWSGLLYSPQPLEIDAELASLPGNVLGAAGPYHYFREFPNRPYASTWYPVGLANTLAGSDLNGPDAEIRATFNSAFPSWYFASDGNTPNTKYDFVSVVMHELGHGLGFAGSMRVSSGSGSWGFAGQVSPPYYPAIYDRFATNAANTSLIDTSAFANPSAALATQLTSGNVFFNGSRAIVAHGGSRPRLYAPSPWAAGSSFSHLDEATYPAGSANSLMTPSLRNGESVHNPGPVTLAILADIGWPSTNSAPAIASLPLQLLLVNSSRNNAIDLWAYAGDAENADNQLTFAIINNPAPQAGVTLDNNRYLDIVPAAGWTGQTAVTIRVADPGGLSAQATVQILVAAQIHTHYLPFARR